MEDSHCTRTLCLVGATLLLLCLILATTEGQYSIRLQEPGDCRSGPEDGHHEFYDMTQMTCTACKQNASHQTVAPDGGSEYN